MSLSMCFSPKTSECFFQPVHFLEHSLWYSLSGEVSAVKMETLITTNIEALPVTMVLALLHLLTPSWLSVSLGRGRKKSTLKALWEKKTICVSQNKVRIWPKVGFWVTLHLYTVCFPQDPHLTLLCWAYGCREQVSVLLNKEKKEWYINRTHTFTLFPYH